MKPAQPNIYKGLLWDVDLARFDFQRNYLKVIERVAERGTDQEWSEINRFYGDDKVRNTLLHEVKYLHSFAIDRVCGLLSCQKQDLLCYRRKQLRPGHFP